MSLNTYQQQVLDYGGGGGEGGVLSITKNVITTTATYLNFDIPQGTTEILIQGDFTLFSALNFPYLYIQFSTDGIVFTTEVDLGLSLNSTNWLNAPIFTSTGLKWYNPNGQLITTLAQVPTTARVYAAKQITPTIPVAFINPSSINLITTSFA